eukprot:ANDGO_04593.mRNA.1 General transcriptional corepressor ssn6
MELRFVTFIRAHALALLSRFDEAIETLDTVFHIRHWLASYDHSQCACGGTFSPEEVHHLPSSQSPLTAAVASPLSAESDEVRSILGGPFENDRARLGDAGSVAADDVLENVSALLVWNLAGISFKALGNPHHALLFLNGAIHAYVHRYDCVLSFLFNNRASVYLDLHDWKNAFRDLEHALRDPTSKLGGGMIYYHRSMIYEHNGEFAAALEDATRAIALAPNSKFMYYRRARVHGRLRCHLEAIDDLERACDLDPSWAEAWNFLGHQYKAAGITDKACNAYNHAVASDPSFAVAWSNRAVLLAMIGYFEEALVDISTAQDLEPFVWDWWYHRALIIIEWVQTLDADAAAQATRAAAAEAREETGRARAGAGEREGMGMGVGVGDGEGAATATRTFGGDDAETEALTGHLVAPPLSTTSSVSSAPFVAQPPHPHLLPSVHAQPPSWAAMAREAKISRAIWDCTKAIELLCFRVSDSGENDDPLRNLLMLRANLFDSCEAFEDAMRDREMAGRIRYRPCVHAPEERAVHDRPINLQALQSPRLDHRNGLSGGSGFGEGPANRSTSSGDGSRAGSARSRRASPSSIVVVQQQWSHTPVGLTLPAGIHNGHPK